MVAACVIDTTPSEETLQLCNTLQPKPVPNTRRVPVQLQRAASQKLELQALPLKKHFSNVGQLSAGAGYKKIK